MFRRHLETKQKAIDDFLGKFSLTEAECKALDGNLNGMFTFHSLVRSYVRFTDGSVSSDFFPALAHAKDIYSQSKQLLRNSGEHSAA